MNSTPDTASKHIGRLTKKYILDFLNSLLFSNTVLWDGDDQYNQLPIFAYSNEHGFRTEQRGMLLVDLRSHRAIRASVVVTQNVVQKVCYRLTGLKEAIRVDESKKFYYPLDGLVLDLSIADLNLGAYDMSSCSFSDNTENSGTISNKKLFALLQHLLHCVFVTIDAKELFEDLIDEILSSPPVPSDPHYKPIFGIIEEPNEFEGF